MAVKRVPNAATKLIAKWVSQGLSIRPGCSLKSLDEFETRSGFVLPTDLREMLELTNGSDQDDEGFQFWPLELYESFTQSRHAAGCPPVEDAQQYYLFCDYLDWSWAYAIRLAKPGEQGVSNRVVPIGMNEMFTVAGSFSVLVNLVLVDSPRLYPPE